MVRPKNPYSNNASAPDYQSGDIYYHEVFAEGSKAQLRAVVEDLYGETVCIESAHDYLSPRHHGALDVLYRKVKQYEAELEEVTE